MLRAITSSSEILGNDVSSWHISEVIYKISGKFLADFKNFYVLCSEVVHGAVYLCKYYLYLYRFGYHKDT